MRPNRLLLISFLFTFAYAAMISSRRLSSSFQQSRTTLLHRRRHKSVSLALIEDNNRLDSIQEEIRLIAGGDLNANSPKQVSMAIFGEMRSTSKNELLKATKDLDSTRAKLASLVLEYREIKRQDAKTETSTTVNTVVDNQDSSIMSHYDRQVAELFTGKSKIDPYWREPLQQLTRPTARNIVPQLDKSACPMGYNPLALPFDPSRGTSTDSTSSLTTTAGKKGSFLAYCREEKEKYPECVALVRCGDFYEAFGVDALMLMEHCGLNPMGGKARAGCPKANVQATLDCLTEKGFRVAVFEEASDTDSSTGAGASAGAKSRIKSRFLAQIVSSASPTYLYNLILLGSSDSLVTTPASRPYVGVLSLSSGYTMVEVSVEELSARVSERLTAEAVACRLAAYPPSDPIFYVPSKHEYQTSGGSFSLPFLPARRDTSMNGPGSRLVTRVIPPSIIEKPSSNVDEINIAKNTIINELLKSIESHDGATLHASDFSLITPSALHSVRDVEPQPLHLETAKQLGLMDDTTIPSLISHILPESAPAPTKRYLRRYLLAPPPPIVGDAMRKIVGSLRNSTIALPPLTVPPLGKVLAMIRAEQASAQVFGEVLQSLHATVSLLDALEADEELLWAFMTILEYESGIASDPESLRDRAMKAMLRIEDVVSTVHHVGKEEAQSAYDSVAVRDDAVPDAFFERNEFQWRGRVREDAIPEAYECVEAAAMDLVNAVREDFWLSDRNIKSPVVQDIFNNLIALKDIPDGAEKDRYYHPRDRNGKVLRNRYTTERVENALSTYLSACDSACAAVTFALSHLSKSLLEEGHLPAVSQASHGNLVMASAFHHCIQANRRHWGLASINDCDNGGSACELKGIFPYWMSDVDAVKNSVNLTGMWMLTSPNMSGKSTLMRSTAAACLMTACGLCAPLDDGSTIKRFDHLFVRGASSDVPVEEKSAFGAEMGDIAAIMRSCGENSLVFVDELGRGTSPRDGTRLAAAILEAMANAGMSGVFATHLHDIINLPLTSKESISLKRMMIEENTTQSNGLDSPSWTYLLEDGICTDSLALVTASRFGLPQDIIKRAEELGSLLQSTPSIKNGAKSQVRAQTNADEGKVNEILRSIFGPDEMVSVPSGWHPPAILDGKSCIYIIELTDSTYYIGETDNFRQRLKQHRSKSGKWQGAKATAIMLSDKTRARSLESSLIQKFAQSGLPLVSVHDGKRLR